MPEDIAPSELTPQRRSEIVSGLVKIFGYKQIDLEPSSEGVLVVHQGLSTGNRPSSPDSEDDDWGITLVFPDEPEVRQLVGTPELMERCSEVRFVQIGYREEHAHANQPEIVFRRDEADQWEIDPDESTPKPVEIDAFLVALEQN